MAGPITPSKIATTRECQHYYYLECFGDRAGLREISAGEDLRIQAGREYEKQVVSQIKGAQTIPWEYPDFKTGYLKTMEVLKKGPEWIHSGVLLSRNLLGIPDLLKRIDRRSKLGNYSYEPIDIKGHKTVQKKDTLQLYSYAYLLETILGYRPEQAGIYLNTGEIEDIVFGDKLKADFERVLSQMKKIEEDKLKTSPIRCSACDTCQWNKHCSEEWLEADHVCLLPKVNASLVAKLKSLGITTCRQLSQQNTKVLSEKLKQKFETTDRLIRGAKARTDNKPYVLENPEFPSGIPVYFYDIETRGSLTVVHGVIRLYKGKREEKSFYAETVDEEEEIWHEFLDYISQDKKAIVYCWTMYEQGHARSLWAKYGGNETGYNLIEQSLTDQCKFVRDHFILPCRGYSIKQVAPVFGFHWQAEDAGGGNCEAWYGRWLETKDKDLRKKIVEYNLDDVRAMEVIHGALMKLVSGSIR